MKKKSKVKKIFLILSLFVCLSVGVVIGGCAFLYNKYSLDTAKLKSVNNGIMVVSDCGNSNGLFNTNRSIVEIDNLPEYVPNAFVDIEDKRFYSHHGFDVKRIAKAVLVNATSKAKSQGASTISQQLIKNALLSNEKTYSRKIEELVLSVKMEKQFSKKEILEMYLNTIYFGSNSYGIENASRFYFNKSAKDLTLSEACCLAGIIKSPAKYSPKSNYENAVLRRNLVAKMMLDCRHISTSEYQSVVESEITLGKTTIDDGSYEEEAIIEACSILNTTERDLINNQYKIFTFKNEDLQNEIISKVANVAPDVDSLTMVCSADGHMLAYYCASNYNLHNLKIQPASALKPFAVYLPCFKHNILSPASEILDEKIDYSGYSPNNADGKFHGYVSVRKALADSLNVPSVKALEYVGIEKAKKVLSDFEFNLENSDSNLSLALGATKKGVNIMTLFSAYNTLSNLGTMNSLSFVKSIEDKFGNVVYSCETSSNCVANSDDCYLINDCLKETAKTGTAKRLDELNINICSKTGTFAVDGKNTEIINCSYTTEHTMLSWISDIKNKTLPAGFKSSVQPTDIVKAIAKQLYSSHQPADFACPENVVSKPIDLIELNTNHITATPTDLSDRYVAYDIFKKDFPLKEIENKPLCYSHKLSEYGFAISFEARKNKTYNIIKKSNKATEVFKSITETNGNVTVSDENIFSYEKLTYVITDENGNELISPIVIYPKEYLITELNNKISSNKKKWYV